MDAADLARLRELESKATKGPVETLRLALELHIDCGTYCLGGSSVVDPDDPDNVYLLELRNAAPSLIRRAELFPWLVRLLKQAPHSQGCHPSEGHHTPWCKDVRATLAAIEQETQT